MNRRTFVLALALLPALTLTGCGNAGGAASVSADERAIDELISTVEGLRDVRTAVKVFAAGAAPAAAQLTQLARFSVQAVGRPAVAGDSATLRVKFVENRTGQETGQTDWTFVKDGAAWKIKSAPLP